MWFKINKIKEIFRNTETLDFGSGTCCINYKLKSYLSTLIISTLVVYIMCKSLLYDNLVFFYNDNLIKNESFYFFFVYKQKRIY